MLNVQRLLELEDRVIAGQFRSIPCCIDGLGNEVSPAKGWYIDVESGDTFEGDVIVNYGVFIEADVDEAGALFFLTEDGDDFNAHGHILVRQS